MADLLEANVHVKGERLPGVADRRDAELSIGGSNAGDHLYCVGPRVVSHLHTHTQGQCKHFVSVQMSFLQQSLRPLH